MGALIWVIIIVAFVIQMNNRKAEYEKKNQASKRPQYGQPQQNAQTYAKPQQNAQTYVKPQKTAQTDARPSQEELKARLKQKYGNVNQRGKAVENKTPDILIKANQNVKKYAEDELHETQCASEEVHPLMHAVQKNEPVLPAVDPLTVSALDESSLMKDVETLMVTGYPVNLEFERDFLGEAMDMLNSYQ